MARRTGPAPKPTAVRRAEGTVGRGASGRNKREPKPEVRIPTPPDELSDDAQDVWRRLGRHLAAQGLITALDEAAFAALCDAYAAFLRCIVKVHGQLVPNPDRKAAAGEFDKFRKLLPEFGLTPASRTRVEAAVDADEGAGDGIDSFLRIAK